jgi:hypothetical protein
VPEYPAAFQTKASVNLGNGILPLETGGRFQPVNASKPGKSRMQTAFIPTKYLKSLPFFQTRKPAQIADHTTMRCGIPALQRPPLGNGILRTETVGRI